MIARLATDPIMAEYIARVCSRHGFRLEEVCQTRPGASVFVARVRNEHGTDMMLKQTSPGSGASEIAAVRAWSGTGVTPRLVSEPEPGMYLAEWIDGSALSEAPPATVVSSVAVAIGRSLRRLHAEPDPDGLLDARVEVRPSRTNGWVHLPAHVRDLGAKLAAALTDCYPSDDVSLHGDLVPSNVILAAEGPRLVDPVGRHGLAAWDIAQLAISAEGRGHHLLGDLLAGYGPSPSLLPEMLAWMALFYLDKNLLNPNSHFTPRLQPLADHLILLSDPEAFMTSCLL